MAVNVIMPTRQKEGALDKVLKGVQLASTILGGVKTYQDIKEGGTKQEIADLQLDQTKKTAELQDQERIRLTSPDSQESVAFRNEANRLGLKVPETLTYAEGSKLGLLERMKELQKGEIERSNKGFEIAEKGKQERQTQGEKLAIEAKEKAAKEAAERNKLAVPDFELDGNSVPAPTEVTKFKSAVSNNKSLKKEILDLQNLVTQHGTEGYGPIAKEMGLLRTSILLKMKNIAELGALAGPDKQLLDDLIADPETFDPRSGLIIDRLETLKKLADRQVLDYGSTLGYKPKVEEKKVAVNFTLGGKPIADSDLQQAALQELNRRKGVAGRLPKNGRP